MTGGIREALRSAVDRVVTSTENVDERAENTGSGLMDRLGDKVFGKTAESETNDAPVSALDASTTSVAQGRRSRRADGQDPFRNEPPKEAPAPAKKS